MQVFIPVKNLMNLEISIVCVDFGAAFVHQNWLNARPDPGSMGQWGQWVNGIYRLLYVLYIATDPADFPKRSDPSSLGLDLYHLYARIFTQRWRYSLPVPYA